MLLLLASTKDGGLFGVTDNPRPSLDTFSVLSSILKSGGRSFLTPISFLASRVQAQLAGALVDSDDGIKTD